MSFLLPWIQPRNVPQRPPPQDTQITVGSAPHLRGYTPRKRAASTTVGYRLQQAQGGPQVTTNRSASLRATDGSITSPSNLDSTPPRSNSTASIRTPRAFGEPTEAPGVVEASDDLTEAVTVLQMNLKLVNPDAARAMEQDAVALHKSEFFQSWPINPRQSLVATTDSLDHWNAIAGVSRVEVLPLQRRFPFIFSSATTNAPRTSGYTGIFTITIVLLIGVVIGAASVVRFIGRGALGLGGRVRAGVNVGSSVRQIFRRQFQLGLQSLLRSLEHMRDIESDINLALRLGSSTSTAPVAVCDFKEQ